MFGKDNFLSQILMAALGLVLCSLSLPPASDSIPRHCRGALGCPRTPALNVQRVCAAEAGSLEMLPAPLLMRLSGGSSCCAARAVQFLMPVLIVMGSPSK